MKTTRIYLNLAFILIIIASACKKDNGAGPNNGQRGTVTEVMESPLFAEQQGAAISENGKYIYLNPIEGEKQISTDGGKTWKNTKITAIYQSPSAISNNGYLFIEAGRSNYKLWDLKSEKEVSFANNNYWASYYIGTEDDIYCYSNSNSQSIPSPLLHKKITAINWDTLHPASNTLGEIAGAGQDGFAFFNTQKKQISIINANTKIVTTKSLNVDLDIIIGTKGNKPMRIKYSGKDYIAFGYTKGCAIVNINTNTVKYTSFPGDMNNHYENPYTMTVSNNGEVFTMLNSYTQPLSAHEWKSGEMVRSSASIPNPCALNTQLYTDFTETKILKDANWKKLSGYETQNAIITAGAIANGKVYSLIKTNTNSATVFLYTTNLDGSNSKMRTDVTGMFTHIYAHDNTVIIIGPGSIQGTDTIGNGLISKDGGLTFTKTPPSVITELRYINGTYYGMANTPYIYYLGGTGFSIPKHKFQMFSSTDGKTWTSISGPIKDESGSGPSTFLNNGYLFRASNLTPLSNPTYVYEESTDWGKTWKSTNTIRSFNAATESKLYEWGYYTNVLTTFIYDYNFEKIKTIEYDYLSTGATGAVKLPIIADNALYAIMSDRILRFSL